MFLDDLDRLRKMRHALAQLAFDAAALLLAHLVQTFENFADAGHHGGFERAVSAVASESSAPGMRRMALRSGSAATRKLVGRSAEGRDVGADQRAIERQIFAAAALQTQSTSTWPRAIFSFSRRRSCISSESEPEGKRKCRSRKRWFTDLSESRTRACFSRSADGWEAVISRIARFRL